MKMNSRQRISLFTGLILTLPFYLKAQPEGIQLADPDVRFYQASGDNAKGKTVIILPGGGYRHHAMGREGVDWVPFMNDLGINVAVLKYKLPDGDLSIPMDDVKKTMELLQHNATEWNVNPADIGVMGSSAGGHLAAAYATHAEDPLKPAFQILFYPVISLKEGLTHQGSKDQFLGADQSEERVLMYSSEEQVTHHTPPAILFHSHDDELVTPENSIVYYQALLSAGVPAALHIYPTGDHGWGFMQRFPFHRMMLEELAAWLLQEEPGSNGQE